MSHLFATVGPALRNAGWPIIPIRPNSKIPLAKGWINGFTTEEIDEFAADDGCAKGNVGLLARNFPALDCDVADEECAAAIEAYAHRTLGEAPVRYGAKPKRLLMYATSEPFSKKKTFLTAPNGSTKDKNGKEYAVEFLADGQQYLIYGAHPDGFQYRWPNNDGPMQCDIAELTSITFAQVQDFFAGLADVLPRGWTIRSAGDNHTYSDEVIPLATYRPAIDGWDLQRIEAELLAEIDPDIDYEQWLQVGMALHHQSKGDLTYLTLWEDWSSQGSKFIQGDCSNRWHSFREQVGTGRGGITLATVIKMADESRLMQLKDRRLKIEAMIEKTTDFDELTKVILKSVFKADLPDSDRSKLVALISKKTRVSVKALSADGAKFRRLDASSQTLHLAAAKEVLKLLGNENLFYAQGAFWNWSERGVWCQMDDREIKMLIHKVCDNQKLTGNVVNSILDMIKTEANRVDFMFDENTNRINCQNGELEFDIYAECWSLNKHVREHYRTTQLPLAFDREAKAPRFEQFLEEIFEGDDDAEQKKAVVEEALGYTLLASCHLEKFFMLIGNGANGKSVLLTVLSALLGPKLICAVQPSQFDNRFQRAHLAGKLANIVTEIAQGATISDDKLKSLVSGELTTAEVKFRDPFDFRPIATHWFGTNHLPRTGDFSDALTRRAMILRFSHRFDGIKRDVHLTEKLLQELPGILNAALRGLARLFTSNRFTDCPSSEAIKVHWQLEADQVRQFVEDCCVLGEDFSHGSGQLFSEYLIWTGTVGIKRNLSHNTFSNRLEQLGYVRTRGGNGRREFLGITLPKSAGFLD